MMAQAAQMVDVDNMMLGDIEESGMVTFQIMPDITEVGIGEMEPMVPVACSEETAVEIGDGGQGSKQESSADTLSADIDNQKGEVVPCSEDSDSSVLSVPNMKKFRPASRRGNKGMFAAKEAASPNKQNLRLQNRARAALKRKKDAIIKKMKELESSTGYTGFFILQSPNEKHVIHGATNGLMQERFEKGEPLMEKETVIRSSCVMRKDADTFFSNINKRVKESNGVASHAPLPSPSKMPHCLKDLAGEQRSSLETIRVVANSNESQTPPVIKRKTTQKKRR